MNEKKHFPEKRLIGGALVASGIAHNETLSMIGDISQLPSILIFIIIAFVLGFIPMAIAYKRNTTNREHIYTLVFLSLLIPFGIFGIVMAIIWSLCDKKELP